MATNKVLEFINTRFKTDCNWLTGNCYYFAKILEIRFNGVIYYDVIQGHFVTEIDSVYYDWSGKVADEDEHYYVRWNDFQNYDMLQYENIIRDCVV